MSGQVFKAETLNPADFDEWVEHCGSIFDVGAAYFRRHFVNDPDRDFNSVFVVKDKGAIISTVRVFNRRVYLGGKQFKMGGIGEVSTNPAYRRLGLSSLLLEHSVKYMRENGYDISVLATGYFSHYAKHGFVQTEMRKKTLAGGGTGGCGIRELSPDFFPEMSALYDRFSPACPMSVVRSAEYWDSWCAAELKNPHGIFKEGRLCGYIAFDGAEVTELIAEPADHDALLSLPVPEDGKIFAPVWAASKREAAGGDKTDRSNMILLLKPLAAYGMNFDTSAKLALYLDQNGGITHWKCDSF